MQEGGLSSTISVRTRIKSTRRQGCRNSILFRTGNLRSEISLLTPSRREDFAIFEGAKGQSVRRIAVHAIQMHVGRYPLDTDWLYHQERQYQFSRPP